MIYIGLEEDQKRTEIIRYINANDIKNVIVLSPQKYFMELPDAGCPIRQIEYNETIMYRTFYPLLEEINRDCLIVFNEFMRTNKRTDLVYNCCAKYTNQTPHRLVFEYLPLISTANDIMVLLDFDLSQRYKGQGLKHVDLGEQKIEVVRRDYRLTDVPIAVPEKAESDYIKQAEKLFNSIGHGDPDTIPRRLHKWCNKYKKPYIAQHPEIDFIAGAASSFKNPNVHPRKNAAQGDYVMIDLPFSRLDWNDLFRDTGMVEIKYLRTPFKVDAVYHQMFDDWRKELESLYAQTGIYAGNG